MNEYKVSTLIFLLLMEVEKSHVIYSEILSFNFRISRSVPCASHGLVIFYEGYTSQSYCGRRVPWDRILPVDHASLRLAIMANVDYTIAFFYSSIRKIPIERVLHVNIIYQQYNGMITNADKPYPIQYSVLTDPDKLISLNVKSNNAVNGFVVVKDGPGPLSNTILRIVNTNTPSNKFAKTSAYWAYVQIILQSGEHAVINVTIQIMRYSRAMCFQKGIKMFRYLSSLQKNIVCSSELKAPTNKFVHLFLHRFFFYGHSTLSNTHSSPCQYGGLTIHFLYADKGFELCEHRHRLNIYSQIDKIYITVAWFSKYSNGYIAMSLLNYTECPTVYFERFPLADIHHHDFRTKLNMGLPRDCYCIICPPLEMGRLDYCTYHIGPPSVGTAELEITTHNTLEHCNTRLENISTNHILSYSMNTTSYDKWPFALDNTSLQSDYKRRLLRSVHQYTFLHVANLNLSLICRKESPRRQMSIFVKVSVCEVRKSKRMNFIVNSIPALSDDCLNYLFYFMVANKRFPIRNNHHDFMYIGNGHVNKGHIVSVHYMSCPEQCRNFKYSIFVRNINDQDIVQYTTDVGMRTFTGYYNRGYRVSIILPKKTQCLQLVCRFRLFAVKPSLSIGTKEYHEPTTYTGLPHFYNKR